MAAKTMRERQRWGLFVGAVALVLFVWMYLTTPLAQLPGSDGYYTFIYARSLVYDGNFDFANEYQTCGDPSGRNRDRGGHHPENTFYVGPTVYWAPVLWVVRKVVKLPPDASPQDQAACRGPLSKWTLFAGPILGALTLFIAYRIARRYADDGPAALAAALVGFGSPLVGYATMWPHYSHVYDAFSCALFLLVAQRAAERPRAWQRWALVGVLAGVCYLQRPPSVFFGLVPAALAAAVLWKQWRALVVALALVGVFAFACGLLPQMLLNHYIFGKYWMSGSPHSNYYMQMGHAHPWLTLFEPHGGLFFSSPACWLSVFGIAPALRSEKMRTFAASGLVACALIVYVSAAALDWDSSSSFGNRRLTSLVAFLVPLAAMFLVRARAWFRRRRGRALVAVGVLALFPIMMVEVGAALGNPEGKTTIERRETQEEIYGEGPGTIWRIVDRNVGDLAVLPAEALYAWRYHLRMNSFGDVLEPWFMRDYRNMAMRWNVPSPNDPRWENRIVHLMHTSDGLKMMARRATLVFTAQWPYATKANVTFRSKSPAKVTVARGRFLQSDVVYGTVDLPGGGTPVSATLDIPKGGFDSGLDEIVLQSDVDPSAEIELLKLEFVDTNEYPNPL